MKKILSIVLMSLSLINCFNAKAEENTMTDKKVLVAYFSATGTTAQVAKRLSETIGANLFEIKPELPYSSADLNWMNKQSRSSIEMADRNSRPAISSKVEDMEKYNIVFVGFPIWWYREPSIIDTFIQSYDFTGKIIVPFATSGGSGMGDTSKIMQELVPQATVSEGKRFEANVSAEELAQWAKKWL